MSITSIQGQLLEVIVVACYKLKDTEWISRQDPYVCLEYGNTKFRTRTCTDGGKNPTFQGKFVFTLIEGLRELNVGVWNCNTLSADDFIGSGKVQLHRVLSRSFDDPCWPLQTKTGRNAGEVKLIMYCPDAKNASSCYAPSAPPYVVPPNSQFPQYSVPPPAPSTSYPPQPSEPSYPPPASAATYPPPASAFPYLPPASSYPASSPYPSYSSAYPPSSYPPPPSAYPQPPHPPTSALPPSPYPPPPSASTYYPSGPYSGIYPPPPY